MSESGDLVEIAGVLFGLITSLAATRDITLTRIKF